MGDVRIQFQYRAIEGAATVKPSASRTSKWLKQMIRGDAEREVVIRGLLVQIRQGPS